ncbi:MAG: hypothetical protein NDJ90_13425 [Oligoflexia bacterium]|nr:hypothetical protein [Oligoflexia bacterium]
MLVSLAGVSAMACGTYEVTGWVRAEAVSRFRLVVAEGTASETVFAPASEEVEARLYPYKDAFIKAHVLIPRRFNGTRAAFTKVANIEIVAPDPLRPASASRYRLKAKRVCE